MYQVQKNHTEKIHNQIQDKYQSDKQNFKIIEQHIL